MSHYDSPRFGLGNGPDAFDWRERPAAVQAPVATPRWSKARLTPPKSTRPAFAVCIASRDSSDRTNSIKGRL